MVRQGLNWAEVLRYRWEYMRRLRFVLAQVDPGGRVRVTRHERQRVREFHARHRMPRVAMAWYRLFKALPGRVAPRDVRVPNSALCIAFGNASISTTNSVPSAACPSRSASSALAPAPRSDDPSMITSGASAWRR